MWCLVMKKLSVLWEGSIFDNHSLANVNRNICFYLDKKADIDLTITPCDYNPIYAKWTSRYDGLKLCFTKEQKHSDFHIAQQWPPKFTRPLTDKWILFQPWEYSSIPRSWIPHLKENVDEIWVNSQFTKRAYVDSGIADDKVFVFPLGIDPDVFKPEGNIINLPTKKKFKFLFVGGTIWRKGIDILLNAYLQSFTSSDDVTLIIKDFGTKSFYQGQSAHDQIKQVAAIPNSPEIIYIDGDMKPEELASLYRSANCLIHPFRGEGFGLPILEAMACGIPVLVPDHGSILDFTTVDNSIRLKTNLIQTQSKKIGDLDLVHNLSYYEVDVSFLILSMRAMTENSELLLSMKNAIAKSVHDQFIWEKIAEFVYRRLTL